MRVLVTGASGFVGGAVVHRLASSPTMIVRAALRRPAGDFTDAVEVVPIAALHADTDWQGALTGVDAVVHAAARVHVMRDAAADPLGEFRRINVEGTVNLARQAAFAGVRRFVFISSIKVNGEHTAGGRPFRAGDVAAPVDPYGVSKYEAEQALHRVARETGLEVVVIRPVLVYGPGVKANVAAMMRWLSRGMPLPLGAVHNKRSLVGLGNLADLIATCLVHPAAPGETFLVSDGEDVSTTALLRRMASALGVKPRLIPVPRWLLRLCARLVGRQDLALRLFDSLQVDIEPTRQRLGWTPPFAMDAQLLEAAQDFARRYTA